MTKEEFLNLDYGNIVTCKRYPGEAYVIDDTDVFGVGDRDPIYGGAEIDHKKKADDDLGFKHKDWVIWTRHPEYGVGMYGYGILGVAFVVFDEKKAGIGGSLVLERELVEAY